MILMYALKSIEKFLQKYGKFQLNISKHQFYDLLNSILTEKSLFFKNYIQI
jgi:hypothetical protein